MSLTKPIIHFEPLVESLSYLSREELEQTSIASRYLNHVIQRNFPSKPYRILKGPQDMELQLSAESTPRGGVVFNLFTIRAYPTNGRYLSWYDIKKKVWMWISHSDQQNRNVKIRYPDYSLQQISPYLPKCVRIALVKIMLDGAPYTPKAIRDLEALSHVCADGKMKIYLYGDSERHDIHSAQLSAKLLLNQPNFIPCRHLIVHNHCEHLLHTHKYPALYNLGVLELKLKHLGPSAHFIREFLRNKIHYPTSETILVVSIVQPTNVCKPEMRTVVELIEKIREDFNTSSAPNTFLMLLLFQTSFYERNLGQCYEETPDDFRLENSLTREVLQLFQSIDEVSHHWRFHSHLALNSPVPGFGIIVGSVLAVNGSLMQILSAKIAGMIPALSFVRLNDVKQYASTLFENLPDCLDQVASWFEHNYIGAEVRRGGRMVQIQPRFPHQLWNVHQRTIDGQHRTNNYAEAGNRRIQSEMGMETPMMGYFIDRLKLIQRGRDQAHVRWLQGYQAKPKRTKYRMADERILKVIEQYDNRSPIEFLGGVALNFMMD
ncbi:hypothetical protein DdX_08168 [Ditylenchus destructor]|uniref:F-box domain-containing protein n=1 Tax=Ditylenchus destructor TaxID=166010 RepID=A0AAD4R7C0_9BILA|nr:hypothetical protein DdX_08168 [Ditylenchus destructor]